jgi:hypothetical protein
VESNKSRFVSLEQNLSVFADALGFNISKVKPLFGDYVRKHPSLIAIVRSIKIQPDKIDSSHIDKKKNKFTIFLNFSPPIKGCSPEDSVSGRAVSRSAMGWHRLS